MATPTRVDALLRRANARATTTTLETMVPIAANACAATRRTKDGTTTAMETMETMYGYEFYASAREMSTRDRDWCFEVTETNMRAAYERTWGWDAMEKRRELNNGAARFVLVRARESGRPVAFVHFRFEREDEDADAAVGYVYELQCEAAHRRRSLGETLVRTVETVSKRLGMEAVVLTVLKTNVGAYEFYTKKMNYVVDARSPDASVDAGSSHYLILSKRLA
jgi:ribosomal protein S18 acetylase RimI-like enzyme